MLSRRWKAKILLHNRTDGQPWVYVRWAEHGWENGWKKVSEIKIRAFRPKHCAHGTALLGTLCRHES